MSGRLALIEQARVVSQAPAAWAVNPPQPRAARVINPLQARAVRAVNPLQARAVHRQALLAANQQRVRVVPVAKAGCRRWTVRPVTQAGKTYGALFLLSGDQTALTAALLERTSDDIYYNELCDQSIFTDVSIHKFGLWTRQP